MLCSASIFRGGSETPQVARDLRERHPARLAIQMSDAPPRRVSLRMAGTQ